MSKQLIATIISVVVFLWIAITYAVLNLMPTVGQSGGVKGDAFGAVNALFSGLALAGVITAILLQSEELKLQREELRDTRDELRGQKEQLAAQVERGNQNEFDSRFFETIRLYRQCIEGLSTKRGPGDIIRGAAALHFLCGFLPKRSIRTANSPGALLKYDSEYGSQIRPLMQILDIAVEMLSDDRSGHFHAKLLKANCGQSDRVLFLQFALEERSCIPKCACHLNRIAFFEDVIFPGDANDLKGLTEEAFGRLNELSDDSW